jgi:hypothetical protein
MTIPSEGQERAPDFLEVERRRSEAEIKDAERALREDLEDRITAGLIVPEALNHYMDLGAKRIQETGTPEPPERSEADLERLGAAAKRVDEMSATWVGMAQLAQGLDSGTRFETMTVKQLPWFLRLPSQVSCQVLPPWGGFLPASLSSEPYTSPCSVAGTTVGLSLLTAACGSWDNATSSVKSGSKGGWVGASYRFEIPTELLPYGGAVRVTPELTAAGNVDVYAPQAPLGTAAYYSARASLHIFTWAVTSSGKTAVGPMTPLRTWEAKSTGPNTIEEEVEIPKPGWSPFASTAAVDIAVSGGKGGDSLTVWVVPFLVTYVTSLHPWFYSKAWINFSYYDIEGWASGVKIPSVRVDWTKFSEPPLPPLYMQPLTKAIFAGQREQTVPGGLIEEKTP